MNVVSVYTTEIKKLEKEIDNLKKKKITLPLIAPILDKKIEQLADRMADISISLENEVSMVDTYISNIMKSHNNMKFKLNQ